MNATDHRDTDVDQLAPDDDELELNPDDVNHAVAMIQPVVAAAAVVTNVNAALAATLGIVANEYRYEERDVWMDVCREAFEAVAREDDDAEEPPATERSA